MSDRYANDRWSPQRGAATGESEEVARIGPRAGHKPLATLTIRGHQRRLELPELAGMRVIVTSDAGDQYAPLVVGGDGVLELPCAAGLDATCVYVRLAPTARAA